MIPWDRENSEVLKIYPELWIPMDAFDQRFDSGGQGGALYIPGRFQEPLNESRTTGVRLENTKNHTSTILGYLVGGFNHLEK
jgi:hypothetical protein